MCEYSISIEQMNFTNNFSFFLIFHFTQLKKKNTITKKVLSTYFKRESKKMSLLGLEKFVCHTIFLYTHRHTFQLNLIKFSLLFYFGFEKKKWITYNLLSYLNVKFNKEISIKIDWNDSFIGSSTYVHCML